MAEPVDVASSDGALGERVRAYRRWQRLSLRGLAERADVSASFLSQLERGRSSASVASLARIAGAMGITIADFFDTSAIGPQPLRAANRPVIRADNYVQKMLLTYAFPKGTGLYAVDLAPGGSTGESQYSHPGAHEVIVAVRNSITVELNESRHVLAEEDSIEFPSEYPHRVLNEGSDSSLVHWLVVPAEESTFTAGAVGDDGSQKDER